MFAQKRKIVYRVLVGTYSDEDEKAHWDTWSFVTFLQCLKPFVP